MTAYVEQQFVQCLQLGPEQRKEHELNVIFSYLHGLEALSSLREPALRAICKTVRYEYHDSNDILYCRGELSTCWYILLSGSVFIDGSMFLPRSSFGKRTAGCTRRPNECLILEPSEMIVIDYPEVQFMKPGQRQSCSTMNLEKLLALEQEEVKVAPARGHSDGSAENAKLPQELQNVQNVLQRSEQAMRGEVFHKRSSRASDTSSAYSGSDMMQSSLGDDQDVDLSGLTESNVDSDEEEGYSETSETMTVRDTVRECLEKDPAERSEDDIEQLLEFMQHLPAFANMTLATRRSLCAVMVFAVVEKAGTIVMNDGEELDSWSVILNGRVEITMADGATEHLHMGDSFGITPTMEKLYHKGVMRTTVDDCQFVCIAQTDYYKILHQGEENTRRHEEHGEVVMVTEHRVLDGGNRKGHIVIRGTPERLMAHLVEQHSVVDPTYVEDFLLTYRTFMDSPLQVANKLLTWFTDPELRDRVTRVVLLWVNNHFNDFETQPAMHDFLEQFELLLEKERMGGQLRLLHIACAAKARPRTIALTRATRDEILHFSVLGGLEKNCGIFISKVEKGSKASEAGLRRGDQVHEVNGHNFDHISHNKALEILRGTTHLSITVKSNMLAFKDMILAEMNAGSRGGPTKKDQIATLQTDPKQRQSAPNLGIRQASAPEIMEPPEPTPPIINQKKNKKEKAFLTTGNRMKIRKALNKIAFLPKTSGEGKQSSSDTELAGRGISRKASSSSTGSTGSNNQLSHSNPDLSVPNIIGFAAFDDSKAEFPEHVVKLYRADQTCKYFLVHKETTAREVVMLALREFGITDPSSNNSLFCSNYSLCEVTVEQGGLVKQKRLHEQMSNLPDRIGLNSRYYLKNNMSTETLVPDECIGEIGKESAVSFLQLNSMELAVQLTLDDFRIFHDIEYTEYIDDLYDLESNFGTPNLDKFADLVNEEMFWVVTEVCSEPNVVRRMKILKHFIKIAKHCKDLKNFNSMFALVSGIGHGSVMRLRSTWDKLPNKYHKMFEDMQNLMDPSRNMSKYRNLLSNENTQPPMIPFFPVVKKDLTFIHLGNDSKVEGLMNFEKLRMIAKEVRHICNMCSAQYDMYTSFMNATNSSSLFANLSGASLAVQGMATMRKNKSRRGSSIPNPKKMFEEAQMVRRAKSYLHNKKVTDDEVKLHDLSHECEPSQRKRDPSPPPVPTKQDGDLKRLTHLGPKFGADEPESIRKLMALSGKVRPHHSKHPMPTVPSPGLQRKPLSPRPGQHIRPTPVHLSSESSSVVSLGNIGVRRSHTSGSVGSSGSTSPSITNHVHLYETDSGHNSIASSNFDSHSTSSMGSSSSPPSRRQPPTPPTAHHLGPRLPLPPYHMVVHNTSETNGDITENNNNNDLQAYNNFIQQQYNVRPRRLPLPDYHAATHMAQLAKQKHHIYDSQAPSEDMIEYYEDEELVDDEDEQVSAV